MSKMSIANSVYSNGYSSLYCGDSREVLKGIPIESIQCVVTSPPYWTLRNYQIKGQLGLEPTPEEYCVNIVNVFREVWRVLNPTGTVWLNLGDSYSRGHRTTNTNDSLRGDTPINVVRTNVTKDVKPKDLLGMPWRVAFALQKDGWYLRSDIIWSKPKIRPESVTDRPTKAHEYIFLLTKNQKYYYDADAIKEPSNDGDKRNKRSVWEITTQTHFETHFATYPEKLVEPCILAGTKPGDTVLDPFVGSGTTCAVSQKLGRQSIGIDASAKYLELAKKRIGKVSLPMLV